MIVFRLVWYGELIICPESGLHTLGDFFSTRITVFSRCDELIHLRTPYANRFPAVKRHGKLILCSGLFGVMFVEGLFTNGAQLFTRYR